ncbi:MAG: beta-ketoacyl-[acyl-carrier-protein] synthase family protein [Alicyclobacillus sp.]|nr:beta-ketoacyl-[acyl-carrier-protein] synthase family protein [Alicyclobacillus sp.]
MHGRTRIAVTGCGAVTPFGVGVDTFWRQLVDGKSAITEMADPALRTWSPAAAHAHFDPTEYMTRKQVMDTDRFTQMAVVAAQEALRDAGFDAASDRPFGAMDTDRIGIAMGSAFGGVQTLDAGSTQLATHPSGRTSPRLVSKAIPNAAAGALAMRFGIRGPAITYATACASSANAIGEASYWLKAGAADMVLAGGAECLFTPVILAGLHASGALAKTGPEDFGAWSRPFDRDRKGMVMGEGAAVVVLEPLERAQARGARIYAELVGYGASNDAYHETSPAPDGSGAALAMRRALQAADLTPADVDYINAHATGTPAGDAAECRALRAVFGEALDSIPVSSIKGAIGHLLGVAGVIESIASIYALHTGWLPPTLNCDVPDEEAPRDVVPHVGRQQSLEVALSNSFGFGGQNGVLVWQRVRG